jgi:hypothetical protein
MGATRKLDTGRQLPCRGRGAVGSPNDGRLRWMRCHTPLCLGGVNLYASIGGTHWVAVAWPVPRVTALSASAGYVDVGPNGPKPIRKHTMTKIIVLGAVAFALVASATAIGLNTRPQSPVVDHSRMLVAWPQGPLHAQPCSALWW